MMLHFPFSLDQLARPETDKEKLAEFLNHQGFKSLLVALGQPRICSPITTGSTASIRTTNWPAARTGTYLPIVPEQINYALVTTIPSLKSWIAEAKAQGFVAIDTETTSLNAALLNWLVYRWQPLPGNACYIPLRHNTHKAN